MAAEAMSKEATLVAVAAAALTSSATDAHQRYLIV